MKLFIRLIALTALCLAAYAATAQQPPTSPPAKAPEAPTISLELKAKYFKVDDLNRQAQAEFQAAQKKLQDTSVALQGVIQELVKACGENLIPQLDGSGDPACVAKPLQPSVTSKEEPAKK